MCKIKDISRLRHEAKLNNRSIAQALDIGYGTWDGLPELRSPRPTDTDERDLGRPQIISHVQASTHPR